MTPEEKIIFNNQEVSKFGKSLEKPFLGGGETIPISLAVCLLLGLSLYSFYHSPSQKPEPTPVPTPSYEQRIAEDAEKLKQEKVAEMGHTDTWHSESKAAEDLEKQAAQKRSNAAEASRLANLSRERQQRLLDNMDLYRQRLLPSPSPSSQPTD